MATSLKYYDIDNKRKIYYFKNNGSFEKIELIGEGSFSKVIKVQKINNSEKELQGYSNICTIKISKKYKLKETNKKKISNNQEKLLKNDDDIFIDEKKSEKKIYKNDFLNSRPKNINFIEIREISNMMTLSHPNVLKLLDFNVQNESKEVWMLFDYIPTNIGKYYIEKKDPKIFTENFFKNIAYQIINGVFYLHKNLIIHRDLKPENILYNDSKNLIQIADFGLSRKISFDLYEKYTNVGTFPYKPPDVLLGNQYYGFSFDVWSIACILVEIITGKILFPANDSLSILKLMFEIFGIFNKNDLPFCEKLNFFNKMNFNDNNLNKKPFGIINYIKKYSMIEFENDYFFDLIQKMFIIDPNKRIKLKDCLKHPWFENLL